MERGPETNHESQIGSETSQVSNSEPVIDNTNDSASQLELLGPEVNQVDKKRERVVRSHLAEAYEWTGVEEWEDFLRSTVFGKYGHWPPDVLDDFLQEGRLAIGRALKDYDVTKGTSLRTYIWGFVNGYIKHYLRDHATMINHRLRGIEGVRLISLDNRETALSEDRESHWEPLVSELKNPADSYVETTLTEKMLSSLERPDDAWMVSLYYGLGEAKYPHTYREIAKITGVPLPTVATRLRQARLELRARFRNRTKSAETPD